MSDIFRAYDVRGIYPDELNEEIAGKIAGATVKFLNAHSTGSGQAKKLVVGEDARVSSPALRKAVLDGATKAGCDVYYIGQCTTPLFYFSVNKLSADGGIMVTASHNPPEYNGLKIVGEKSKPVSSETGLKEIEKLSGLRKSSGFAKSLIKKPEINDNKKGNIKETSLKKEYIDFLLNEFKNISDKAKNLKIVIDASNGMTPLVLNDLLPLTELNISSLYFDIDGTFPNHLSDTSREENLKDLKSKVLSEKADIGVAFDGDGDRMAVVDEKGGVVRADITAALIYGRFYKNERTAYDSRFSRAVKNIFGANGIASKTGHSFVKTTMRQNDCSFGGELSGHFFFKEMNYADSAILAMLRLVEILAKENKPISQLVAPFIKYANSGEINIKFEGDNEGLINTLKEKYSDGKISELDGITVDYPDWWFNARFSNTESLVRVVVEADTQELMEEKKDELVGIIIKAAS